MLGSYNHIPPGPSLSVPTIRKLHSNSQNSFIIETNTDLGIQYLDMFLDNKAVEMDPMACTLALSIRHLELRFNFP